MTRWVTDDQRSNEWLSARVGCLTASKMAAAMSFLKTGKESEERRKLKMALVSERMTGLTTEVFVNDAMKWGIEMEDRCKERVEEDLGVILAPCGFALHDTVEYWGASPDALIGEDAIFEGKAPTSVKHVEYILAGVMPPEYKPQMLCQMLVTGRTRGVFASFDPRILKRPRQIFITEYIPTQQELDAVQDAAVLFLSEVDELFDRVTREEIA